MSDENQQGPMNAAHFRSQVADEIVQRANASSELSRRDKRRIARVMNGGWFNWRRRERVLDEVCDRMHAARVIEVYDDGVQAATNWDDILSFIERLMPLILQLISLFGG